MAIRRDEQQYENFDWQQDAACRGEHAVAFFPPPHFERKDARLARERRAKSICRTCPVVAECLDAAMSAREPHGVWGGLNEIERRQLADRHPHTPGVTIPVRLSSSGLSAPQASPAEAESADAPGSHANGAEPHRARRR